MRIGLVGAPAHDTRSAELPADELLASLGQNTGNIVFQRALRDLLDPAVESIAPGTPLTDFDALILCVANALGPTTDMGCLADELARTQASLIVVGLGAQSDLARSDVTIPAGTAAWLDLVRERAPSAAPHVLVRGEFTRSQLERLGFPGAAVTGCPSFLLTHRGGLGARLAHQWPAGLPARVGVVAGTYGDPVTKEVDRQLLQVARSSRAPLPWILQQQESLLGAARGEGGPGPAELRAMRLMLWPTAADVDLAEFVRDSAVGFFQVDAWREHLRRFDLVVGLRFHGVMLALQTGVPAVLVVHDSRTAELADYTRIPYLEVDEVGDDWAVNVALARSRFDPGAFDEVRRRTAATYAELLGAAGVPLSASASQLL